MCEEKKRLSSPPFHLPRPCQCHGWMCPRCCSSLSEEESRNDQPLKRNQVFQGRASVVSRQIHLVVRVFCMEMRKSEHFSSPTPADFMLPHEPGSNRPHLLGNSQGEFLDILVDVQLLFTLDVWACLYLIYHVVSIRPPEWVCVYIKYSSCGLHTST